MLFFSLILVLVIVFVGLILTLRQVMVTNAVSATRHLEELNRKFTEKEAEVDSRMAKIDEESEKILERARLEAEGIRDKVVSDAGKQRDEIIKDAGIKAEEIIQKAEKSRKTLLLEIEERIGRGAAERAQSLVQENLPEKYRQELHRMWSRDVIDSGFGGMERLHSAEDISVVEVASAFALTDEQRKEILEKISKVLNKEVSLKEEISPKLIAGIIIKAGSLVFDGSLLSKMTERMRGGEENAG